MAETASPTPQDATSQWQAFRDRVGRTRERLEEVDPRVSLYALIDTRATPDLRERRKNGIDSPQWLMKAGTEIVRAMKCAGLQTQLSRRLRHRFR